MSWSPAANPPPSSTDRNALWLFVTTGKVIEGGYSGGRFISQNSEPLDNVSHWSLIGPSGHPPHPYPVVASQDRRPRRQSFLPLD